MHRSAPGWSIFSGKTGAVWRCVFATEREAREYAVRLIAAKSDRPVTWASCRMANMLHTIRARVVSVEGEDD